MLLLLSQTLLLQWGLAPLRRVAHEINQSVTGYVFGDLLTSLIAGVVARIGSTVYDGSVRGQLAALGRRLSA